VDPAEYEVFRFGNKAPLFVILPTQNIAVDVSGQQDICW